MKWMLSADSDYEKILNKKPEKAIENYDDLRAFENRCSYFLDFSIVSFIRSKVKPLSIKSSFMNLPTF